MEELKNRNGSEKLVKYIDLRDDIYRNHVKTKIKKNFKVGSVWTWLSLCYQIKVHLL